MENDTHQSWALRGGTHAEGFEPRILLVPLLRRRRSARCALRTRTIHPPPQRSTRLSKEPCLRARAVSCQRQCPTVNTPCRAASATRVPACMLTPAASRHRLLVRRKPTSRIKDRRHHRPHRDLNMLTEHSVQICAASPWAGSGLRLHARPQLSRWAASFGGR